MDILKSVLFAVFAGVIAAAFAVNLGVYMVLSTHR